MEISAPILPSLSFPLTGVPTPKANEIYLGEIFMDVFGVPTSVSANTDEAEAKRGFHDRGPAQQLRASIALSWLLCDPSRKGRCPGVFR